MATRDDCLTKPFAIVELFARIRSLIRRATAGKNNNVHRKVMDLKMDLKMDLIHRKAARGDKVLNLSPQEFALLEYLCRHAGRVVARSMLLSAVWGMRIQPDTNVVDVHIYRLRGKVDGEARESLIQTLKGIGYVLRDK